MENNMGGGVSTDRSQSNETLETGRPPNVGLPEDESIHEASNSPPIWTAEHAALVKGSPPPRGISLRAFEGWYRDRLVEVGATESWSPSRQNGYTAMIDLWIRISTNRKPSPDAPKTTVLSEVPPRFLENA